LPMIIAGIALLIFAYRGKHSKNANNKEASA